MRAQNSKLKIKNCGSMPAASVFGLFALAVIFTVFGAGMFLYPNAVSAADNSAFSHLWTGGYWGADPLLLPCHGIDCLKSYTGKDGKQHAGPGACGLLILFQNLIYLAMSIVLYIIVPIRLVWGGALILISAGSAERVGAGRKMIYNTLIGVLVVLCAFVIINTFLWLLLPANSPYANWWQIDCTP